MLSFINVASGSKGNATLIYDENTLIQVDMGISLKRLKMALSLLNKEVKDIKGLFITHDHSDHIGTICRIEEVPTYTALGNLPNVDCVLTPYEEIKVNTISVMSLVVSHDATNPIGFVFKSGDTSLLYMTDTGFVSELNLDFMKNHDYYIIESNHDLDMLYHSGRPQRLIDRIHGKHGHLSNPDSAIYMCECVGRKTKAIYLAHLSEECNTEEKALSSYYATFERKEIDISNISISCLKQWEMTRGGDYHED